MYFFANSILLTITGYTISTFRLRLTPDSPVFMTSSPIFYDFFVSFVALFPANGPPGSSEVTQNI
jgi:hypothetical protein